MDAFLRRVIEQRELEMQRDRLRGVGRLECDSCGKTLKSHNQTGLCWRCQVKKSKKGEP
jgi:Zn finger protein HypA/HybF involved in hydrogenase expression